MSRWATAVLCGFVLCVALAWGAAAKDTKREEEKLRATDAAWLAAVKSRDVERIVAFWAEDARILPPDSAPIVGKAAIRKYVADALATPGFAITWELQQVTVARSGDLAYTLETNHVTVPGPGGAPMQLHGNATAIWKRQPNGEWQCVVDTWAYLPPAKSGEQR